MNELSKYYFIDERGKLCCNLEGSKLEVVGAYEYESGRVTFKHKIVIKQLSNKTIEQYNN